MLQRSTRDRARAERLLTEEFDDRPMSNEEAVDLREYFDVLRRRYRIIVFTTVLCLLTVMVYSNLQPKVSTAEATVLVEPVMLILGDPSIRQQQLVSPETEREIARSSAVASLAVRDLNGRWSGDDLRSQAEIVPVPGTEVLRIQVTDADPGRARLAARALARAYLTYREAQATQQARELGDRLRKLLRQAEKDLQAASDAIATSPRGSVRQILAESRRDSVRRRLQNLQDDIDATELLNVHPGQLLGPTTVSTARLIPTGVNLGVGLAVGLLIGILLAFVRDRFDDRVRDIRDIERHIGLPVLAEIPNRPDAAAEAYRRLRVWLLPPGGRPVTIVATSAVPDEPKSEVAAYLAVALSQAGEHVALVSADLRSSQLEQILDLGHGKGLRDLLIDSLQPQEVLRTQAGIANLEVITSGTTDGEVGDAAGRSSAPHHRPLTSNGYVSPHPSELLHSQRLRDFVARPWTQDVVIFDAAPVLASSDGLTLSALVTGVLVVAERHRSRRRHLAATAQQLAAVGATTLGVVLHDRRGRGRNARGAQGRSTADLMSHLVSPSPATGEQEDGRKIVPAAVGPPWHASRADSTDTGVTPEPGRTSEESAP